MPSSPDQFVSLDTASGHRRALTRESQRQRTGQAPQRWHRDWIWKAAQHASMKRHRQAPKMAAASIPPPDPPWLACVRVYAFQKCVKGTARL